MGIFAKLDQDGRPVGFYTLDIHKEIPDGAISITHAQWQEFLNNQGTRKWDGEKIVECEHPIYSGGQNITEAYNLYFLALGRFMHNYAEVEATIQVLLWRHAEVSAEVAQSIFSGTRIDAAMNYIKRIFQAKGGEISDDLKSAFAQISAINTTRNLIIHYGCSYDNGGFLASNVLTAHTKQSLKEIPVSPEILDDMTRDLATVKAKIVFHMLTGIAPAEFIDAGFRPASLVPWRYNPNSSNCGR